MSNAERLEMENAKMEERLRTLRKTIEKEKEERRLIHNLLSLYLLMNIWHVVLKLCSNWLIYVTCYRHSVVIVLFVSHVRDTVF